MYHRILIANRSDCAVRLIRACHEEGIEAYLISARDDVQVSTHEAADGVIFTGMSRDAYESQDDILEAARHFSCEAILPGWGFLSEDYAFAQRCRLSGIHFIGPTSRQLQIFGDKLGTIRFFGEDLPDPPIAIRCDAEDLSDRVSELGWPLMLKCRYGGGGKGVYCLESRAEFDRQMTRLGEHRQLWRYYIEPAVKCGRHIEFQYFGDGAGDVILAGGRDCTPQRYHQKYLETSIEVAGDIEFSGLADRILKRLKSLKYQGAGTVEFLVGRDGGIQLLELNPRIQVEHGVTELVSGIDLVRSAIRTSCAGRMEICETGGGGSEEAVEFRLFARSSGVLKRIGFRGYAWPSHRYAQDSEYRIETSYREGDEVTGVYDGLLARFMVCGSRGGTHAKLRAWLEELEVEGLEHNLEDLYE